LAIIVWSHVVARTEYEHVGDLRSENKREYLVLGSQELLENSRRRRDGEEKGSLMRRLILDYIEEIGM